MIKEVAVLITWVCVSLSAFPFLIPPFSVFLFLYVLCFNFIGSRKNLSFLRIQITKKYSFLLYFFLIIISTLFSLNYHEGFKHVESHIGFFLWPSILILTSFKNRNLITKFVNTQLILVCIMVVRSFLLFFKEFAPLYDPSLIQGTAWFFTDRFSFILHPSYFSMYLAFALSYVLIQWRKQGFSWMYLLQALFLAAGIFCCNSVMGNVVGLLIGIVFLLSFLISADLFFKYTPKFLIFIALMCMLGLLLKKEDLYADFNSYYAQIDKTTTSSIPARVLIWKTCLELIPQSGFFGVGIGDVKDVLTQAYQAKGYTGCFEHQFNAHNQFLQTTLAVGFPGLLTLLGMLLVPFYQWWKQRNLLGIALIGIVFMNLLVESMFERQAGSIFFVFATLFMIQESSETV